MSVQSDRDVATGPGGTDRATRILQVLIVIAVVESFVHYADNTIRYDDYTVSDPTFPGSLIKQWVIPISWLFYTFVAAPLGYLAFRRGDAPKAAAWIGVYSTSGLISLGHYVDISLSDLSAFQNAFVFGDVALGALLLAFAVWTALYRPAVATRAGS